MSLQTIIQQPQKLAKGLGWFSVGLGSAELCFPGSVAKTDRRFSSHAREKDAAHFSERAKLRPEQAFSQIRVRPAGFGPEL